MLGLALREASECQRCGGDLHETLDYGLKWEPQPPAVCLRCVGLRESQKRHKDHPQAAAMIHTVAKRARPKPKPKPKRG